jgi:C-terminal processing protease CtpA/Prc
MTGVLLATNRFNTCVKALKAQGYKELETVGSIGILLHEEDASGFRIRKVYANSPAEKAGIIRGDIISAIDGHKVTQCSDMAMLQGAPGSPVTITVNRNGTTVSYNLIRALSFYDRMLGDITYRP